MDWPTQGGVFLEDMKIRKEPTTCRVLTVFSSTSLIYKISLAERSFWDWIRKMTGIAKFAVIFGPKKA